MSQKPPYRLLYNQDCTNLFMITSEPITVRHVEHMVDEVADAGVDVLLVNSNAQKVCYPSKVWQTFWDGYNGDDSRFWGTVPPESIPSRRHMLEQMKLLAESGCDYLACALNRCRQRGIVTGVTVRMNDMHDVPWPDSPMFSDFYLKHPEYHIQGLTHAEWSNEGLNYAIPQVREHYLALIRELIEYYRFEVLELDFLRFTAYFPRGDIDGSCRIMTSFLEEVNNLIHRSGRQIALIPRITANPASARELGFDVAEWSRRDLIDGITVGSFLSTAWQIPVGDYHELIGSGKALYVATENLADRRPELPERYMQNEEYLRGFAAANLAAGADGINIFNFFCARERDSANFGRNMPLLPFAVFKELKSREFLRGRAKTYMISAGTVICDTDQPEQVPVEIPSRRSRLFEIHTSQEVDRMDVKLRITVKGAEGADLNKVWTQFNVTPLGFPAGRENVSIGPSAVCTYTYDVPFSALHDGVNRLVVRNEGPSITVLGIEIEVGLRY